MRKLRYMGTNIAEMKESISVKVISRYVKSKIFFFSCKTIKTN